MCYFKQNDVTVMPPPVTVTSGETYRFYEHRKLILLIRNVKTSQNMKWDKPHKTFYLDIDIC
jgi:hypothetical protein